MQQSNNETSDGCFDELVEETQEGLARYVRRIVSSPDDVQGVLQEAYLKVFVALQKDRATGHQPSALLYTTARNIAISRLRHQKVVKAQAAAIAVGEELRADRPTAEQNVSKSQRLNSLLLVVNQLPPKCRDVFVLRWVHGLSQRSIGERLGISVSTVEKHLAKGLRLCRQELAK